MTDVVEQSGVTNVVEQSRVADVVEQSGVTDVVEQSGGVCTYNENSSQPTKPSGNHSATLRDAVNSSPITSALGPKLNHNEKY